MKCTDKRRIEVYGHDVCETANSVRLESVSCLSMYGRHEGEKIGW